jgi:hypothetical protein
MAIFGGGGTAPMAETLRDYANPAPAAIRMDI